MAPNLIHIKGNKNNLVVLRNHKKESFFFKKIVVKIIVWPKIEGSQS